MRASRSIVAVALAGLLLTTGAHAILSSPLPGAWTQSVVGDTRSGQLDMDVDASGVPHVVATRGSGPSTQVYYYARTPLGWSAELIWTGGFLPDIAVEPDGTPHVAFSTAGTITKYAVRHESGWMIEDVDTVTGGSLADVRVRLDSTGSVHLGYGGAAGTRYGVKTPTGWITEQIAPYESGLGFGFDIDSQGNAHFALYPGSTSLVYVTNAEGSWITANSPSAGANIDLEVDAQDVVHVAFQSNHQGVYGKKNVSGWQFEVYDGQAWTGMDASIEVDPLGRPHVTYIDQYGTSNAVDGARTRYATRSNSGVWSREIAGPVGWNSGEPRLSLDAEGYPRVAYWLVQTQGVTINMFKVMYAEPVARTIIPYGVAP